jgi:hypothetical protein
MSNKRWSKRWLLFQPENTGRVFTYSHSTCRQFFISVYHVKGCGIYTSSRMNYEDTYRFSFAIKGSTAGL